ncbi:T-complex protein 11 [Grus japonensis]|uniref:T-complex protein 11 n=1 Tax=Grus japonensis TaxID=30415 RepID=A0ABC9XS67_GRUJA
MDMLSFTIQSLCIHLQDHTIQYEWKKFQELLDKLSNTVYGSGPTAGSTSTGVMDLTILKPSSPAIAIIRSSYPGQSENKSSGFIPSSAFSFPLMDRILKKISQRALIPFRKSCWKLGTGLEA